MGCALGVPAPMSDAELLAQVARGQQRALGVLYDRYAGLLLVVLRRVLRDPAEAQDVLHEVFLEVWRHADDFDPARGNVRAWLIVRARARGLDKLRALTRTRGWPEGAPASPAASAAAPAETLSIRRALSNLAPELRTLLELGYFEGMSTAEIAACEGIPVGTVKSRVARALAQLRGVLGQV